MPKIWIATTTDKYELPICIARTAEELARKLGTNSNTIMSAKCKRLKQLKSKKQLRGRKAKYYVYTVEDDEAELWNTL